jgi:hypothetical protein
MKAIRRMKGFCLVCVGLFLVGAVIHSLTMGSFKSVNHLSKNPNPERLPKELVKDMGDFIDRSGSGISSVLHAILCYAACCLAERFAVGRKPSPAELDYTDQPRSPGA